MTVAKVGKIVPVKPSRNFTHTDEPQVHYARRKEVCAVCVCVPCEPTQRPVCGTLRHAGALVDAGHTVCVGRALVQTREGGAREGA